jgi:short-subunit dehydrogenase
MTTMFETALVTGASSGIGKAVAKRLAREGVHVAISARRTDALEALADEIERAGGKRPIVLLADLSKRGEAARLGAAAEAAFGSRGVDVLVSNAGVGIGGAQLIVADDDIARALFETNYWSPLALARAIAPGMRARGRGHIVHVTSIAAVAPMPLMGHYASSKAALSMATDTLRMELRDDPIHVFEVVPGPVDTPMLAETSLIPGGEEVFKRMPRGTTDVLADKILRGLRRRREVLVYPGSLAIVRHLPTVTKAVAGAATRSVDVKDTRAVMGGSTGNAEIAAVRAKAEARAARS